MYFAMGNESVTSHGLAVPDFLQNVDVAIIARGDLCYDSRVQKEVRALLEADVNACAIGIATCHCSPGVTRESWGTVVRVETRMAPPSAEVTEGVSATCIQQTDLLMHTADTVAKSNTDTLRASRTPYTGRVGDLRHWVGRMRENRIVARAVAPLHPRVIIACDLSMLYAGYLLKRRCGAKLIYDSHELWVDSHGGASRLFRWLYTVTERRFIHSADMVMTVNDAIADELMRRYSIPQLTVVMNGPDACIPNSPALHRPLRVLFQGQFGANRGLHELILAMRDTGDEVILTLQGFGGIEHELRSFVTSLNLDGRVRFAAPCDPADTVTEAARHDVGVISYRPSTMNLTLSSPVKLFDYLGAGLAILSTDLPVIRKIAGEEAACYVNEPDAVSLALALRKLADDPERVVRMKAASHDRCADLLWNAQVRPLLRAVRGWCSTEGGA